MTVPLPVLWLCGAPATGKSTVAWELFNNLAVDEGPIGYVDIDQLGMLYPAPDDDLGHAATKAKNLAAVVNSHRAAGTSGLLVSGVVDPSAAPRFVEACAGTGALTFCHLRLDEAILRARLAERGWPEEAGDASMAGMRALTQAAFVDATVDTSGRSVAEVVARVRPLFRRLPGAPRTPVPTAPPAVAIPVTVVCGPRAVGKSSVSWAMFMESVNAGVRTGYVDLEQISFVRPMAQAASRLKIRNLASHVATFTAHGARHVIANGMVDSHMATVLRRLGSVSIVRLVAGEAELSARIASRATNGGGPRLIGDDLHLADGSYQAAVLAASVDQGRAYDRDRFEDLRIDAAAADPQSVATYIENAVHGGWRPDRF
jgi:AAA domain